MADQTRTTPGSASHVEGKHEFADHPLTTLFGMSLGVYLLILGLSRTLQVPSDSKFVLAILALTFCGIQISIVIARVKKHWLNGRLILWNARLGINAYLRRFSVVEVGLDDLYYQIVNCRNKIDELGDVEGTLEDLHSHLASCENKLDALSCGEDDIIEEIEHLKEHFDLTIKDLRHLIQEGKLAATVGGTTITGEQSDGGEGRVGGEDAGGGRGADEGTGGACGYVPPEVEHVDEDGK